MKRPIRDPELAVTLFVAIGWLVCVAYGLAMLLCDGRLAR